MFWPDWSERTGRPRTEASALGTSARSAMGLRSTKWTPSLSAAPSLSPAATATVVLPMPPGPTSVTKRWRVTCSIRLSTVSDRPKIFGRVSLDGGAASAAAIGAVSRAPGARMVPTNE